MSSDAWLREIAIDLMAEPQRLRSVLRHEIQGPFTISPHHHVDELQLDLVRGCSGRIARRDQWLKFEGPLALITYPGVTHGYHLEPRAGDDAWVFHFKIQARGSWDLLQRRILPSFSRVVAESSLFELGRSVVRDLGDPHFPRVRAILGLLSLLEAWPTTPWASGAGTSRSVEVDSDVEAAVSLIEARLDQPPTADEIAARVGLSTRHLTRLFRRSIGMTPHRYATVRRLDRARVLLLRSEVRIADIADELGFASHATFTRWFRQQTGGTPEMYRKSPSVF